VAPEQGKIPLARPLLGEEEEQALLAVVRSGRLSLGPRLAQFEAAFAAVTGARFASAVSSGTAALHLALRAVGVEAGAEVITTPFSFVASANVILYERAVPVFVDIDPVTLNIDPDAVAAAVGGRTAAVLPVHIFGYPAPLPALERIAARHGLAIVEDACEALGGVDEEGVPIGGRGNLACFGFYPNKQITTGEGGMVVCNEAALKERIDSERNQGREGGMGWLEHRRLGFNYRLPELACALGLAQLRRLPELLAARERAAERYRQAFGALAADLLGEEGIVLPCENVGKARRSWFIYPIRLPRGVDRGQVIERLAAAGIETKAYLPAIHLLPFYRERFGYVPGQFPVCEEAARRSLALPFFPGIEEGEVERVVSTLAAVLREGR